MSGAGEWTTTTMSNLTNSAVRYGDQVTSLIKEEKRRIGILKGEYYKYALYVNMKPGFSKSAENIFEKYRENVDNKLSNIISDSEDKLSAIYDRLSEDNKESWSQAADTCRKLFKSVADNLFKKCIQNTIKRQ